MWAFSQRGLSRVRREMQMSRFYQPGTSKHKQQWEKIMQSSGVNGLYTASWIQIRLICPFALVAAYYYYYCCCYIVPFQTNNIHTEIDRIDRPEPHRDALSPSLSRAPSNSFVEIIIIKKKSPLLCLSIWHISIKQYPSIFNSFYKKTC